MDKMKKQIRQKLVANILMDQCVRREHLIFREAWCSQERIIRFTTPFFRNLFSVTNPSAGKWGTGDEVMYEVQNEGDALSISCVYAPLGAAILPAGILQSWVIADTDVNQMLAAFDTLIDKAIPCFEKDLKEKLEKQEQLSEGAKKEVFSRKYERNPKARAVCLAHHGYTCKVCGMSFEETYGAAFKGIIEVHHIVPLKEIGKNYVVDPIKDLIPICPNCHTAIHSKNGDKLQLKNNDT